MVERCAERAERPTEGFAEDAWAHPGWHKTATHEARGGVQMLPGLDLETIERLTGGRLGVHEAPCPLCGPARQMPANRRKPVLRVWRLHAGFATFHCARCGERGHVRDGSAVRLDPAPIERSRKEAAERESIAAASRQKKARSLWSMRRPVIGSIAETYLREVRGYSGQVPPPLPATLGFLPARGDHGPAMIAAFGVPHEPEPGLLVIADDAVRGVHLTRLAPDGTGKAGTDADKIMIGRSAGSPIVLAPANDLLGIAVTEGIEDALSVHLATGLGAWAAGSASRLPALADAIPSYVESVTILVDDDEDGRRHAGELAARLLGRGLQVRQVLPANAVEQKRPAA
jgi:hypothetical protein